MKISRVEIPFQVNAFKAAGLLYSTRHILLHIRQAIWLRSIENEQHHIHRSYCEKSCHEAVKQLH